MTKNKTREGPHLAQTQKKREEGTRRSELLHFDQFANASRKADRSKCNPFFDHGSLKLSLDRLEGRSLGALPFHEDYLLYDPRLFSVEDYPIDRIA